MSVILVYGEQRGGVFRKPALESLTQGRCVADQLGADLAVLIAGSDIDKLAREAGTYGADLVYTVDRSECLLYHTEVYTALLVDLIDQLDPRVILMGHTSVGKDLAPRVAEKVNAGLVSDCINIAVTDGGMAYTRPIYAGKAFARVSIETPLHVVTLRPNVFPVEEKPGRGKVVEWNVTVPEPQAKVESVEITDSTRPELTEAEVIVSGGRGLGDQKGFELLGQLADLLGAALGASRSAVDSGWIPQAFQVGQTGKVVTPSVYVACGISGAIQHLAGMGSSKLILAVNNDPEANIFQIADFGIVADLYEAVPEFISQLQEIIKKG